MGFCGRKFIPTEVCVGASSQYLGTSLFSSGKVEIVGVSGRRLGKRERFLWLRKISTRYWA